MCFNDCDASHRLQPKNEINELPKAQLQLVFHLIVPDKALTYPIHN